MSVVCRTCMIADSNGENMVDIFTDCGTEPTLYQMLTICTDLKITEADDLPKTLCKECQEKLQSYYDFRTNAALVERKLRKKTEIKIEKQEIELKIEHEADDNFYSEDEDIPLKILSDTKENVKKVVEKKDLTCHICNKSFAKLYRLKRHSLLHDVDSRPFSCEQCTQRFKTETSLIKHQLNHKVKVEEKAAIRKYSCKDCSKEFQSTHSLIAHMKFHIKPKVCPICNKCFGKLSHLKRHELTHPQNRPFKCSHCTKSYPSEALLNEHILNRHNKYKPFKCEKCDKRFSQEKIWKMHLSNHDKDTTGKTHVCPICGKCFAFNNLKQHLQRHAGVKQFACKFCPNKFVSKGELKSHLITHTGHKPYKCDTCGSAFTKNTSLTKHKMRHLGIKKFECDECTRKFVTKDHLRRHQRTHTGEKPYQCEQCGRSFSQTNDLIKHKRSHFGENLYKCEQCGDSFRLKTELRRHEIRHFAAAQSHEAAIDLQMVKNDEEILDKMLKS